MKGTKLLLLMLIPLFIMAGCGNKEDKSDIEGSSYTQISMEEAKDLMLDEDVIIVDVRRQDEYEEGHIPGAICIPNESISDKKPVELPDFDQVILVYCRSGRRSKEASQKFFDLGYRNIYEFGGIIDWDGEIVIENSEQDDMEEKTSNEIEELLDEDDTEDSTTEQSKKSSGGASGGKLQKYDDEDEDSSKTTRKKKSSSATTEFDPEDHDIEGYYEDNRDEFDDIDDAYDAFEDDEDAWDDY